MKIDVISFIVALAQVERSIALEDISPFWESLEDKSKLQQTEWEEL